MFSSLQGLAERANAAFLVCHHPAKGNHSEKSVSDLGAGAGSQSRAADTHLALREHQEADCAVLAGIVRSWPPFDPVGLRWTFPTWNPDLTLDVNALKRPSKRVSKANLERLCSKVHLVGGVRWE